MWQQGQRMEFIRGREHRKDFIRGTETKVPWVKSNSLKYEWPNSYKQRKEREWGRKKTFTEIMAKKNHNFGEKHKWTDSRISENVWQDEERSPCLSKAQSRDWKWKIEFSKLWMWQDTWNKGRFRNSLAAPEIVEVI